MSQTATREKKKTRDATPLSREDQVAERRQSLLDAAVAVIAKKGLIGVTIRRIAAEAKCSYGVVSFHFKSKDGIIIAALDYLSDEYEQLLARGNRTGVSPARRLKTMIESDFDGRVANAKRIAVWVSFWAETVRVRSYRKRCAELKARYNASAEADVAALAKERGLTVDAAQVAHSLNAMIDGFWIANLVGDNTGQAGQLASKEACLAYLRSVFPDDF
ncbi:TetR family transcriptional regulator C-terminal domain-containing protein [Mesorhizobium sp. YC-39]|uniref:TetR family transcriptional regulator C-terminal domain-containing protein n=1 Tax=unclassified Mesorhizobium TaxID=325217 RepID=UPI0021E72470|nr:MULTISPECIES: TetR family transcriptional regulator C-terminal domain-containing protein [unclassified Mesorhizobium]MCV3210826.1 TetR family transcriptional regulator C-terminal domain-containing protein [Mesorhizobium sp. YC-2]MCV3231060.1 TetR family transcriptional regulator C-terminal domain-containing protein [Mesorhizobium sp. YC-39]